MPFVIRKKGSQWCVYTQGPDGGPNGEAHGCHNSEDGAKRQMAALYVHVPEAKKTMDPISAFQDAVKGIFGLKRKDKAKAISEDQRIKPSNMAGKAMVLKQLDGSYRWFGWVSNHFRDRDNPPEIISGKAHREFVAHAEKTGEYPELWLWHVPGSKVGKADWLEFADGFLLTSGLFDKGKEAVAGRLAAATEPLTMSHGFRRFKADKENIITHQYRMVEASILPVGAEANPWTKFTTAKEARVLSPRKREFLVKIMGEEAVTSIEADTDGLKKAAEAAGVDWKEVDAIEDAADSTVPAMDVKAVADQLAPALAEALNLKGLSDMLVEVQAAVAPLAQLQVAVKGLQEQVTALKADDDSKIAAQMAPRNSLNLAWMNKAASRSDANVIAKDQDGQPQNAQDKALIGAKPGLEAFAEGFAGVIRGGA